MHDIHSTKTHEVKLSFLETLSNDYLCRNEIRCGCNRVRRDHSGEILERTGIPWEKNEHTQSVLNNAYGILSNNHSYYIRCDIETSPNILAQLLFQFWNIKPPRLIMSIIGGAKYFKLNERLEREFIKGIIQVALKAGGEN